MKSLLEKTRKITRTIQQKVGYQVDFNEMAELVSEIMEATVYVFSNKGKLLGSAVYEQFGTSVLEDDVLAEARLSVEFNQELLKIDVTSANLKGENQTLYNPEVVSPFADKNITIVPLAGGGERLGTLILAKADGEFTDADLILAEYAATVVGLEIVRSRSDRLEDEVRKKAACQIAIGTLSFSEQEAVEHIFDELDGEEGLLVASKIADSVGITRSVIVNALRKLESAGVIESRSLGMKGTYIRVLNEFFLDELAKHRTR
ncbi:MAG: GTP-sensing pleiotropic transcriptional regulator CodY [Firmicutes bacterium]|jgi:transcriptional pleiotropic repressor|nr:GTP-sensing pleiotropic transcriptional regulator CodY [Bacillota bacterium]